MKPLKQFLNENLSQNASKAVQAFIQGQETSSGQFEVRKKIGDHIELTFNRMPVATIRNGMLWITGVGTPANFVALNMIPGITITDNKGDILDTEEKVMSIQGLVKLNGKKWNGREAESRGSYDPTSKKKIQFQTF